MVDYLAGMTGNYSGTQNPVGAFSDVNCHKTLFFPIDDCRDQWRTANRNLDKDAIHARRPSLLR
jgi:hypothetical protein